MKARAVVLQVAVCLIAFWGAARCGAAEGQSLVEGARGRFGDLTEAEKKLFRGMEMGMSANYSGASAEENDPGKAGQWGDERVLKGDRIAWLCRSASALGRWPRSGLLIKGARIEGVLDLSLGRALPMLVFEACAFEDVIKLNLAETGSIFLNGSHLPGISGMFARVRGSVCLGKGFKVQGCVNLMGATIDDILAVTDGEIVADKGVALELTRVKVRGDAVLGLGLRVEGAAHLAGAVVDGGVSFDGGSFINEGGEAISAPRIKALRVSMLNGFKSVGLVELRGAVIAGALSCDGAQFVNAEGTALKADSIEVGSDVFLSGGFRAEGEVLLAGARIGGQLVCDGATIVNPGGWAINAQSADVQAGVFLRDGFRAEGEVDLRGARIGQGLACTGGKFAAKSEERMALNCAESEISRSVLLNEGFEAEGEVRMAHATVGGDVICSGARLVNKGGIALLADGVRVGHRFLLDEGFEAEGEVSLNGGTVGGNLVCSGGKFANEGRCSLSWETLKVQGSVHLDDGFRSVGEVDLAGANIGMNLDCRGGDFRNRGGAALRAEFLTCRNVSCDGMTVEGDVDFIGASVQDYFLWTRVSGGDELVLALDWASVGTLWDDRASWPKKGYLHLEGFVYQAIAEGAPSSAGARLEWLRRQGGVFRPGPYEQLAQVLRGSGDEEGAREVLIVKEKDRRRLTEMSGWRALVHWVMGWLVGYGYQPWRAVKYMLYIVAFGWLAFGAGSALGLMRGTNGVGTLPGGEADGKRPRELPGFNFFVYSVDVFVPVVDLHQEKRWQPDGSRGVFLSVRDFPLLSLGGLLRTWMWFQIVVGWILTTLFVVALSGLIRL